MLRRGDISIGDSHSAGFRSSSCRSRLDQQCKSLSMAAIRQYLALQTSCATCQCSSGSPHRRQTLSTLIETRPYYNPERRTPVNIVPGLMGVILMMTMMLFTAVAIVREKERGNLELLINTPVSSAELMVGKVLPYVLIGLLATGPDSRCRALAVRRSGARKRTGSLHCRERPLLPRNCRWAC